MKFFSLYFVMFFIFGCSQNKKEMSLNLVQNPEINSKNIVEEIDKESVTSTEKPLYFFVITKNLCFLEILVNDIPLIYDNKEVSVKNGQTINRLMQNSGIQKVTIKMYPYGKNGEDHYDSLMNESSVKIKVVKINSNNTSEEQKITEYETSNNTYAGKNYHEESFNFNADIPFKFTELENAQDLKQLSSNLINEKIIDAFNKSREFIVNNEQDNIARLSFPLFKRQFISEYYTKEKMNEIIEGVFKQLNNKIDMKPIDDYEIVYYGNGKIVSLVQKNQSPLFKHKPALWGNIKIKNIDRPIFFPIYLYLPKGKTEFEIY